jgi:hypothetical protein
MATQYWIYLCGLSAGIGMAWGYWDGYRTAKKVLSQLK